MGKYLKEVDKLLKLNKITSEESTKLIELYNSTSLTDRSKDFDEKYMEKLSKYRDVDVLLGSLEKMVLSIKNNVQFFFWLTIINFILFILFLINSPLEIFN